MESAEKNHIKYLIKQVKVLNNKYDVIKKLTGENFNIFSILNLESDEVKTHSYFIFNLLDPKGSHEMGEKFLRLFLKKALQKEEYEKAGKLIAVKREDPTDESRRIDFTIELENLFIAVEMKIYASDQPKQLADYKSYIQNKKNKTKLFYLTLYGDEASTKSTKGLEVEKDYFLLSFYTHIYEWLQECIEKSATVPTVREGLVHYKNLIQKLTNQSSEGVGEEMEDILKSSEDIRAANTLVQEYKNIWAKKEAEFWSELKSTLENKVSGLKFEVFYNGEYNFDDNEYDFKDIAVDRNRKDATFGLHFKKNILSKSLEFYLNNQNTDDNCYFGTDNMGKEYDELIKKIGLSRKSGKFRYVFLKENINFYGKNVTNPTFELFDKTKFDELIESTAEEVYGLLRKVVENEDKIIKAIESTGD